MVIGLIFLLGLTMGFFDERVLAALRNDKPKDFTMLLDEVGFSHNTLQQHLERLTDRGLVVREKVAGNGFGRPTFAYHVPSKITKQVNAALEDMPIELVAIAFSRLRHVCRFEKGGHCKETKRNCAPQIWPQTRK
jgi:predicted ArsR family transcriptional regulator